MKYPLVSVIIPTYNRAEMLLVSIKSVLNQTYSNFELLIIDDGSTDNTKKVVKKIKDKRIRYYHKKNEGPAAARNIGISKASGKYISFLDDDDEYLPEKIKLQVELLEKNLEYVFCFSNVLFKINKNLRLFLSKPPKNNYLSLLLNRNFIVNSSVMLRRKIVNQIGFLDTSLELAQDYDFWLRITKEYKFFVYLDIPLVVLNKHEFNRSNKVSRMSYYDGLVKFRHLNIYKKTVPEKYQKKFKTELAFQKGRLLHFNRKYQLSRKYLVKTIKLDPKYSKAYILILLSYIKNAKLLDILIQVYSRIETLKFRRV